MTILIAGTAYVAVCFMCRGAGPWKPAIIPHCSTASNPQYAILAVSPVVLLMVVSIVAGSLLDPSWWWFAEVLTLSVSVALILDAFRRISAEFFAGSPRGQTSTPSAKRASTEGETDSEEQGESPYILICAEEPELIKMEADFRLSAMMGKTPFRDTRIASSEALAIVVENYPTAAVLPWPELMNEKIFTPHVETESLCREKIADALASETAKMAAELENGELRKKLNEALEANRKYEKVLQDLRSRPSNAAMDYSKMTPSQRSEEERRLKESLVKIQDLAKNPQLPQVNIPSYFKQPGSIT